MKRRPSNRSLRADDAPESSLSPERLYARYAPRIERHVQHVLGSDSEREDLVHDILLTVLCKIHTLRNPNAADAWVREVTANTLRYTMRKRSIRRHAPLDDTAEPDVPSVQLDVEAHELASRALRVMQRLPNDDRLLLARHWLYGATPEALAVTSSCSAVTIRRRLSKARARFERLALLDPALSTRFA